MINSFVFMNPLFQCDGVYLSEEDACLQINNCTVVNDFTAVFEDGLYCEKQLIRTSIQSIFAVGLCIGVMASGFLGNILGKKKTMVLILVFGIIGYTLMLFAIKLRLQWLIIVSCMLVGVNTAGLMVMTIILTCQICPQKMKEVALPLYCSIYGIGEVILGLTYFYMPQWDKYLTYLLITPSAFLLILTIILQIQTPLHILLVEKNDDLFQQLLDKISFFDKKTESQTEYAKALGLQMIQFYSEDKRKNQICQQIFSFCQIRDNLKPCLCLVALKMSYYLHYYGTQGSMERIGLNFGVNTMLMGVIQFFAYLTASYLSTKTRRRKGLLISITLCISAGLLFLLPKVQQILWIQTSLLGLIRLGSVFFFSYLLQLQTESVGIKYRSMLITFVFVFGQVSRIFIPYMITYFNNHNIQTVAMVSILLGILGIGPGLLLKETFKGDAELKDDS